MNTIGGWLRRVNNGRGRRSGHINSIPLRAGVFYMQTLRGRNKDIILAIYETGCSALTHTVIIWSGWLELIRVDNLWNSSGIDRAAGS